MNQSLKRLLFHHYKKIITGLIILIAGIYSIQTMTGIISWQKDYKYFSSEKAHLNFQKQLKDSYEFEDQEKGKIFLFYDLKKEHAIYTDDFDTFKDYSLTIFNSNEDANQQRFNAYPYYNEHFIQLLIVFIIVGILLFLIDLKSNFNTLLFTSKYKRSSIYWYKYYYIGGTLSLTLFVSKALSILAYRFFIPHDYLNISLKQQVFSSFSGWLTLVSLFILSSFLGLIIGDWLFGIAATLVMFFTFNRFLLNIDFISQTFFNTQVEETSTVSSTVLNNVLPLQQVSIRPINYLPLFILVFSALLVLFIGQRLFEHISLEDRGSFIIIPKLKRLIQLLIIFYGMITFSAGTFLVTAFPNEQLILSEQIINYTKIFFTFIIIYYISEFILFDKKPIFLKKINL
ncbi:hypothetical protein P7H75_14840 [Vagococcus carniphilus]|uniref:hypothetical protein n=1 Tax=Vagococcus carniphilus TaxID=218144 RepID=UPI00288FB0DA|nr:hypothetical protein [Vagococcus carniphilus]MDT2816132.1 hypothetical protein [Vagococcus carniphilus]